MFGLSNTRMALQRRPLPSGDVAPEVPSEEDVVIAPGHGSGNYDITTINAVTIDNFSFIQFNLIGLTWTTTGTITGLGLQLSPDGGTTMRGSIGISQANATLASPYNLVLNDQTYGPLTNAPSQTLYYGTGMIYGANDVGPTLVKFQDNTVAHTTPANTGWHTVAEVHNLLRFKIILSAGADSWTGGTIQLKGWR